MGDRQTDYVELYVDAAGEFRWRRKAANHEPISASGEGYESVTHAREMAEELNPGIEIRVRGDVLTPVTNAEPS